MAKKDILIATRQLRGGKSKGEREFVQAQEELTAAKQKALGLSKDDVQDLIETGAVIEIPADVGSGDDSAEVKAANKRADDAEKRASDAETKVAELTAEIETLKTQLEAAKTEASKAKGS